MKKKESVDVIIPIIVTMSKKMLLQAIARRLANKGETDLSSKIIDIMEADELTMVAEISKIETEIVEKSDQSIIDMLRTVIGNKKNDSAKFADPNQSKVRINIVHNQNKKLGDMFLDEMMQYLIDRLLTSGNVVVRDSFIAINKMYFQKEGKIKQKEMKEGKMIIVSQNEIDEAEENLKRMDDKYVKDVGRNCTDMLNYIIARSYKENHNLFIDLKEVHRKYYNNIIINF